MADISLVQDVHMDDSDEGVFEQGDCSPGNPCDDYDGSPPLSQVQKYAASVHFFNRRKVPRIVKELFQTAPAEVLSQELPSIMSILSDLGEKDEATVRADLLEQIPHMASEAVKYSNRVDALKNVTSEYLLPLVVRNLGCSDNAVDKAAHSTLIHLLEQGLITKIQAEIQVCPAILALSEQSTEIKAGAITLMSRIAPFLGRDITERILLRRFSQLCTVNLFSVRRVCASHIGEFCAVVGKEEYEKVLLPCYLMLCQDEIWEVRKSCAEVIMFVSVVCSPEIRKSTLVPAFAKLLQDDCRWVQMSAFQTLGPFITTFAEPSITNTTYNNQGELVFVNNDGNEFLINPPSIPDVRFCKYLPRQPPLSPNTGKSNTDMGLGDWWQIDEDDNMTLTGIIGEDINELDGQPSLKESFGIDSTNVSNSDEDIKEMVETVKNAVLSYRNIEQEDNVIENVKSNRGNANVITSLKELSCDNLDSSVTALERSLTNLSLTLHQSHRLNNEPDDASISNTSSYQDKTDLKSANLSPAVQNENIESNQVILHRENAREDDHLPLFNSFNYWYISPAMPVDLSIFDGLDRGKTEAYNSKIVLEDSLVTVDLSHSDSEFGKNESTFIRDLETSNVENDDSLQQDIVPQVLINHFFLMTDSTFSIVIDNEMPYHCAYSLPAVALTLKNNNWPLLKETIERLASNMQYKVRRTVASSLYDLAVIFGRDIASEHLTPIFDGFIKDLDEVRIGILRHLAYFLKFITPVKRKTYLPRLQEFLKTENVWNWRFRYELAKQLLSIVTLFKPKDSAKHIGFIAEMLLHDVSAVRQVAISLITELLRYISTKPDLNSLYLVRLVEKFAHSKKWKKRQTFALLCNKLLASNALPPEQFAPEIMPHLLDLSWDPVANVRLVVAKTLTQHIIPNEYFADPASQHFDSLGTVIRRLQADKDRDVRYYAEMRYNDNERSVSPPNTSVYDFE